MIQLTRRVFFISLFCSVLFTRCTQARTIIDIMPHSSSPHAISSLFLSTSDGASNPLRDRSHPQLLYTMIVHYFRPPDPASRFFCPPFPAVETSTKRRKQKETPLSDPSVLPNPRPHSRPPPSANWVFPCPIHWKPWLSLSCSSSTPQWKSAARLYGALS